MLEYASSGEIELRLVSDGVLQGIKVVARDQGPGIEDLDLGAWVTMPAERRFAPFQGINSSAAIARMAAERLSGRR